MCINTGKKIVRRNYTRLPIPDSIIKKIEESAKRERVQKCLHFRNRQREMFEWENKNYNDDQNEQEEEMSPYPDIEAELPGVELEEQKEMQEFDADHEKDKNKEAVDLERNCNLDEPQTMNNNDKQRQNLHHEENLRKLEIVEVNEQRLEMFRHYEIVEVDGFIENFEAGDGDM